MGSVLALAGLVGLGFGLASVIRPLGRWGITTRARGAGVVAGSLLIGSLGAGLTPPEGSPADVVASAETTTSAPATTIPGSTTPSPSTTTSSSTSSTTSSSTTTTTRALPDVPQAEILFAPPSAGPSGDPAAAVPTGSETLTVTGITDGDTLEVRLASGTIGTLRLIGINSPESGECFADEAALVLEVLTPVGTQIGATLDTSDRDQYGRLLRYLWVGAMSVNEEMVRRGAAIARRYPPDTAMSSRLELAEDEARSDHLGLWEPDACGPDAGTQIVVEAVEADSPGNDNETLDQETVRIRNDGSIAVDMTGWVLKDESASHRFGFPAGYGLAAGAVVVVHTGCGTNTATNLYWCSDGAVWNNDGDTAFILDHSGNIVHSLPYTPPTTSTASTVASAAVAPVMASPTTSDCHASYTGECVPITSDVDCLGGSGNGPAYVGRVNVVGPDVYDLDRDNDGIGCDSS